MFFFGVLGVFQHSFYSTPQLKVSIRQLTGFIYLSGLKSIQLLLFLMTAILFCDFSNKKYISTITVFNTLPESFSFVFSVDGLAFFFLLMTSFIMLVTTTSFSHSAFDSRSTKYTKSSSVNFNSHNQMLFGLTIVILQIILVIFFFTENIFFFFIAFEASVFPIFFIITLYGKRSHKFKALYYLFFFTIFSAIPLLFAIIFLYTKFGTMDYTELRSLLSTSASLSAKDQALLFLLFFIPFSVKLSFFPFHG
jgi:NADH-quinone oxidoreductase subunit M